MTDTMPNTLKPQKDQHLFGDMLTLQLCSFDLGAFASSEIWAQCDLPAICAPTLCELNMNSTPKGKQDHR